MSQPYRALLERRLLRTSAFSSKQDLSLIFSRVARKDCRSRCSIQRRLQSSVAGQYQQQQYAPPPPKPSFIIRTLRLALGASTFLLLGVYLGWETLPAKPEIQSILAKPPSDSETLTLYEPPDDTCRTINQHILQHPLATSLRADPSFLESRPHLKIPPGIRPTNLTGGTLAGPGRIVVPPLQFSHNKGASLVSIFYLGPQLCGHPGIIHGGLLATLLDEGLARCCFPALPNGIGMTANLQINYRKPVRAEGYYVLRAETTKVEGRKAWVRGWIEPLSEQSEIGDKRKEGGNVEGVEERAEKSKSEVDGKLKLVEAEGLFVEPRNAQLIKRIYQP